MLWPPRGATTITMMREEWQLSLLRIVWELCRKLITLRYYIKDVSLNGVHTTSSCNVRVHNRPRFIVTWSNELGRREYYQMKRNENEFSLLHANFYSFSVPTHAYYYLSWRLSPSTSCRHTRSNHLRRVVPRAYHRNFFFHKNQKRTSSKEKQKEYTHD